MRFPLSQQLLHIVRQKTKSLQTAASVSCSFLCESAQAAAVVQEVIDSSSTALLPSVRSYSARHFLVQQSGILPSHIMDLDRTVSFLEHNLHLFPAEALRHPVESFGVTEFLPRHALARLLANEIRTALLSSYSLDAPSSDSRPAPAVSEAISLYMDLKRKYGVFDYSDCVEACIANDKLGQQPTYLLSRLPLFSMRERDALSHVKAVPLLPDLCTRPLQRACSKENSFLNVCTRLFSVDGSEFSQFQNNPSCSLYHYSERDEAYSFIGSFVKCPEPASVTKRRLKTPRIAVLATDETRVVELGQSLIALGINSNVSAVPIDLLRSFVAYLFRLFSVFHGVCFDRTTSTILPMFDPVATDDAVLSLMRRAMPSSFHCRISSILSFLRQSDAVISFFRQQFVGLEEDVLTTTMALMGHEFLKLELLLQTSSPRHVLDMVNMSRVWKACMCQFIGPWSHDKVYLNTIRNVRGLEFDSVIMSIDGLSEPGISTKVSNSLHGKQLLASGIGVARAEALLVSYGTLPPLYLRYALPVDACHFSTTKSRH